MKKIIHFVLIIFCIMIPSSYANSDRDSVQTSENDPVSFKISVISSEGLFQKIDISKLPEIIGVFNPEENKYRIDLTRLLCHLQNFAKRLWEDRFIASNDNGTILIDHTEQGYIAHKARIPIVYIDEDINLIYVLYKVETVNPLLSIDDSSKLASDSTDSDTNSRENCIEMTITPVNN
jgi:hypothetical protein